MNNTIIIIGAGLSGLHAASLLTAKGFECKVLEARDRCGGRVLSTSVPNNPELGEFDLGPTWFWPQYEHMIANLTKQLHIKTFEQYTEGAMVSERVKNIPPVHSVLPEHAMERSMRMKGGLQTLIKAIADTIPPGVVELKTQVKKLHLDEDGAITVETKNAAGKSKKFLGSRVILALPPRIVASQIEMSPSLPQETVNSLVHTPTWMAGQAKVVAIYDHPFWRDAGLSGFATSWVGPLQEIHDASPETRPGALFGFFGLPAEKRHELRKDKVLALVKEQLGRLFGESAHHTKAILYKDWSQDAETAVKEDLEPLRDFPRYGQPPRAEVWRKKLIFAGTETASQFGGHLEGALRAAEQAVAEVTNSY